MPIRMVPDEGQDQPRKRPVRRRTTPNTGGGGGGSIISALLGLLFRKPKLILLLLVGFGLFYYFGGGCNPESGGIANIIGNLTKGANFDPALYDKVEVFEPLADNVKNPLPERVTLQDFAPQRLNQGQQGSCVGWASAYAARSIMHARQTGQDPRQARFSPSYLYNQIKLNEQCQGAYIHAAMDRMEQGGVAPFSEFGYDDRTCQTRPPDAVIQNAGKYKIKGYQRLTQGGDDQRVNMLAMKQNLAQKAPVVIGMMVGGSFMQDMQGQDAWYPNGSDYNMPGFGGHAMCVIGYDDYKFGNQGGFQIMNSWGPEWGKNGLAWVSYSDFDHFTREAYGLYPMGGGVDVKPSEFDIRFGLLDNESKRNIELRHIGGRTFRTASPVQKGSKFKIEVANNDECYVYVFGEETDGSTYTLFPYTPKHSPYCGITGTRLFPNDHSLQPDNVGSQDQMAILITNQPFDYPKINEGLNRSISTDLEAKLIDVLGSELSTSVRYDGGATVGAKANAQQNNAIAIVIQMDKM